MSEIIAKDLIRAGWNCTFANMRAWISLQLAILFFTGEYHLQQMTRLPLLISHIQHHKKVHGSSLADFYLEHYIDQDSDTHDAQDDLRLPYKQHSNVSVLSVILQDNAAELQDLAFIRHHFANTIFNWPNELYRKHWQPPC